MVSDYPISGGRVAPRTEGFPCGHQLPAFFGRSWCIFFIICYPLRNGDTVDGDDFVFIGESVCGEILIRAVDKYPSFDVGWSIICRIVFQINRCMAGMECRNIFFQQVSELNGSIGLAYPLQKGMMQAVHVQPFRLIQGIVFQRSLMDFLELFLECFFLYRQFVCIILCNVNVLIVEILGVDNQPAYAYENKQDKAGKDFQCCFDVLVHYSLLIINYLSLSPLW